TTEGPTAAAAKAAAAIIGRTKRFIFISIVLWVFVGLGGLAHWPEGSAHFLAEELRLFPRCEVAAEVDLVEVDKVAECALDPTPRRAEGLIWEDSEGCGHGDRPRISRSCFFPIESRRGCACVRDPVERHVVEELVTRQRACRSAGKGAGELCVADRVVVKEP